MKKGFSTVMAAQFIPRSAAPLQPIGRSVGALVRDFADCNARLWADKLGQVSLATTTLFWGASANLKNFVFAWAAVALGYTTAQTSALMIVLAVGTAAGAVAASMRVRLDQATRVIPLGVGMGLLVIALSLIHSPWAAAPLLLVLGGIGGHLVVPVNALLCHRGASHMGAGRSPAVQDFNEQACILGFAAFYIGITRLGVTVVAAVACFGRLVAAAMAGVLRWHRANQRRHDVAFGNAPSSVRAINHSTKD